MSRIYLKNLPRLKLTDLIHRRRMTLRRLMDEYGIITYASLVSRCERLGVQEPTLEEYEIAMPALVTSQSEGVVVLEAPQSVPADHELTEPLATGTGQDDDPLVTPDGLTKKLRKRKDGHTGQMNE